MHSSPHRVGFGRKVGAGAALALSLLLLPLTQAFGAVGVTPKGAGGSSSPNYASTLINIGDTVNATLTITNLGIGGTLNINQTENVLVSNIFFTPSCGGGSGVCTIGQEDKGVFAVANPTADATTACAGKTFSIIVHDTTTGELEFVPNSQIVLGPSALFNPVKPAQCIINFTLTALKLPTKDAGGGAGIQTIGLSRTALQGQTTGDTAQGTGSITPTVTAPVLTIAKTPDGGTVNAGSTATFTIVVTNTGTGAANNVVITDTLPNTGGVVWSTATPNCSVSATNPQVLTCTLPGPLAPGASFTAAVTAPTSAAICATYNNTATATGSNVVDALGNPVTVSDGGSIACQAPALTIAKTPDAGGAAINAGATATFTIVVTNTGVGTANSVTITDTLPNNGGVIWATATGGCGLSATNPQVLTCNVGTLASGASFTAVVTATTSAAVCTVWNNTASASASNSGTVSDPGQITCLAPGLAIAKTPDAGAAAITSGQTATFTIVVTNTGAGTANSVTITDTLPNNGGVTWATATGGCSISATNPQVLTCNVGTLAPGAAFTAVVTASTSAAVCTVWNNTASASASNAGTVTDPGQITCQVPVLTIAKTPDGGTITAGATATFTIVVTNSGPGTATGVTITDTLPNNGGVTWATATAGCSIAGSPQVLTCNVGSLNAGSAFTAVVTAATSGGVCATWNNTATATSTNSVQVTDAGSIVCSGTPSLTISKTPDGQTILPGAVATFNIVVTNTGTLAATGVVITDTLPAGGGVTWTTLTPNCSIAGASGSQVLTCNVGTLATGASFSATVSATTSVGACTTMNNTATATSTNAATVNDPGSITCVPPPPALIPTLSEWVMVLLASLLIATGLATLRRRNRN